MGLETPGSLRESAPVSQKSWDPGFRYPAQFSGVRLRQFAGVR
jgi:hypothetical protein